MLKGNSKPQEKKLGLYSAPCRRNQLSNFEEKKKDSFWNNIPPGQCDPYGFERVMKMIQRKKSILVGLIFYGNF